MDALAFLEAGGKIKKQPVFVVTGDEDFLRRRAKSALTAAVLGEADPAFALSTYPGDKTDFASVRSELETLPFLCDRRLVVIEQADPFVTNNRERLEKYVAAPAATGVLVLDVKTWMKTTKLAKLVPESATIVCKAPFPARLSGWCVEWARKEYAKKLPANAAALLIEFVGPHLGLLDSELNKLSTSVGDRPSIERADIDSLVGRGHAGNVFRIMDAIGDGQPNQALAILSELFESGEPALKILGALSSQLRKLGTVARLHKQGVPLPDAMDQAGAPQWQQARDSIRKQMKHLGWNRLDQLFDWLVELDLGLKGDSPLPEKLLLERLIVRMGRPHLAAAGRVLR